MLLAMLKQILPAGQDYEQILAYGSRSDWQERPAETLAASLAAWNKFDVADYLSRYPDIAEAKMDPILHFVRHGIWEGRIFNRVPSDGEMAVERFLAPVLALTAPGQLDTSAACEYIPNYSIIVTLWKRKSYLREQYMAFMRQSVKPSEIIYLINGRFISEEYVRNATGANIRIIQQDFNSLYTRFALVHVASGEFVAIVDDDIIPGEFWFANAIRACRAYNAYVVANGRIFNRHGVQGFYTMVTPPPCAPSHKRISCCNTDVFCDWGCNSYFLKREWAGMLTSQPRYRDADKTYDDIQSATSLFMAGGIKCVCPVQPAWDSRLHGSLIEEYGNDAHAVWLTSKSHFPDRLRYLQEQIKKGYVPVQARETLYNFHLVVIFEDIAMLERCILSIMGQSYNNFTCTLVDNRGDDDPAPDLVTRLGIDQYNFRYLKLACKVSPTQALAKALALLDVHESDIILDVDAAGYFPHSQILKQLNGIYRQGSTLVTYGNVVRCLGSASQNSSQYVVSTFSYEGGANKSGEFPLRRLSRVEKHDTISTLIPLSVISFQAAMLATFSGQEGGSFLQVMEMCPYEALTFIPDVSWIANGTSKSNFSREGDCSIPYSSVMAVLEGYHQDERLISADVDMIFDHISQAPGETAQTQPRRRNTAVFTCVSQDRVVEALMSLGSYRRNIGTEAKACIFLQTADAVAREQARKLFANTSYRLLLPSDTVNQAVSSHADSAMGTALRLQCSIMFDLLVEHDLALYLSHKVYTVDDVTDIHTSLFDNGLTVISGSSLSPTNRHGWSASSFVKPELKKFLHSLSASSSMPNDEEAMFHRLLARGQMKVAATGNITCPQVDFQSLDGVIAPSQRSYLSKDGAFLRMICLDEEDIEFCIAQKTFQGRSLRFLAAVYLLSWMFVACLVAAKLRLAYGKDMADAMRLRASFQTVDQHIRSISNNIPLASIRGMWNNIWQQDDFTLDSFLTKWANTAVNSICFDNLELFAQLLDALFGKFNICQEIMRRLRKQDLRYVTENVLANQNLTREMIWACMESPDTGKIMQHRLQKIKEAKIYPLG